VHFSPPYRQVCAGTIRALKGTGSRDRQQIFWQKRTVLYYLQPFLFFFVFFMSYCHLCFLPGWVRWKNLRKYYRTIRALKGTGSRDGLQIFWQKRTVLYYLQPFLVFLILMSYCHRYFLPGLGEKKNWRNIAVFLEGLSRISPRHKHVWRFFLCSSSCFFSLGRRVTHRLNSFQATGWTLASFILLLQ
jgi:hypothetical protein